MLLQSLQSLDSSSFAHKGYTKNAYKILVTTHRGKRLFGGHWHKWEAGIEVAVEIYVAQEIYSSPKKDRKFGWLRDS
jgi:hypothetical protein